MPTNYLYTNFAIRRRASHFFFCKWILHIWSGFHTWSQSKISNNWLKIDILRLLRPLNAIFSHVQSLVTSTTIQGVSKKRYFLDFLSYFSSIGRILLFHMCFGIRILSPFHLAIQKVSIQNLNCPKNACADMIFIPAQSSLRKAGIKIMSAHTFLGQLRFWMDTFWIARWNGLEILIPKHMWKNKIGPLEWNKTKNHKTTFF